MTPQLQRLLERFDADPADATAFETLEEQLFLRSDWTALVPLYERHLAAAEGSRAPGDRARLLFRMAQAREERGDDANEVEACHRRALELDPGFAPSLRRLRMQCTASGRLDEALALAEREAASLARATDRAALLAEVGELALREGRAELAARAFEQALAFDAGTARAWLGLGEALERLGRVEDAVAAWSRSLERLGPGTERARARRALGRLLVERAGDLERARAVYEAGHAEAPEEAEWLEALARTLRALERPDAIAALADARLSAAADVRSKAAIAFETGRLHLDLRSDATAARTWLLRALDFGEDGDVHLALAEASGRLGQAAERTWHLERAMELGAEIPSWSGLGLGGEPSPDDDAVERLRAAASARPDDPDAWAALDAALAAGHQDAERIEVLERLAALAPEGAERADFLLQLGELHESRLDDPAAAAEACERALLTDPDHPGAAAALARVLRKLERIPELRSALERAAEGATPARRADLLCATGELLLDELDDAPAAATHFAAAIAADPQHARARSGATRAAELVGDEEALVAAGLREVATASDERLAQLLPDLVRQLVPLGRLEDALAAARRWVELAAEDRDALETLAGLLEETGHTEDLATLLVRLDAHLEGPARGANQRRLGWLHAAEGRSEQAIAAWRSALTHDPSDLASLEAALEALDELDRPEEALALLDALPATADREPRETAGLEPRSLTLLRARALERGSRHEEAAALYRALRDAGEAGDALLEGLERTARARGDAATLAEALATRAATADPALRDTLDAERAMLLEDELARPGEARALWERLAAEARDPALTDTAARRLETLLERIGDFPALCERLESRAQGAPPAEAWSLHARLAELAEARLDDAACARRHLELALALAPRRVELWRRLANLCDEAGQPAELLRALEGELACAEGEEPVPCHPERALGLHLRAAHVAEHQLGDPERAEGHWRRVRELDPQHAEALERLSTRAEAAGRFEEVAALLHERLDALTARSDRADGERRSDLRLRLAAVLARRLGRRDEAIAVLERAEAEPGDLGPAAGALAELYREAGRLDELAALTAAAADAAPDAVTRTHLWMRLAEARRDAGDESGAGEAYERALDADPHTREPLDALCALRRRQGDAVRLAPLLERALRGVAAHATGLERSLRRELADLYEGPLAAPDRAFEHWLRLVDLAPEDEHVRERAVELAELLARHDDACVILWNAAVDPRTGEARAACWAHCAELLAGPLRRPEDAVHAWRSALALSAAQPRLRRRLRETLEALDRPGEALAELRAEWAAAAPEARAELAAHGADLAAARVPSALPLWLDRLAASAPDDPELWVAIARLHRRAGSAAACERALAEAVRRLPVAAVVERRELQRERAHLLERELGRPGSAAAALEEARRIDPRHAEVLADLDRIYTAQGRLRELRDVLRERRADARRPEQQRALIRRAAETAEALGETSRAADLWQAALEDPALPAGERAALRPRAVDALRAAARLETWPALAEEELGAPETPAERRLALRRALLEACTALGRSDRALVHARALVDEAPGPAEPADRQVLLERLRAEGEGVERARRLAAALAEQPDGPDAYDAWCELARLREERLAAPAAAAAAWREALRLAPDAGEAWAGLRRTAERCGDWAEVARALEVEATRGIGGETAARWRRLGEIRWQRLGDAPGAERAWLAAREAAPDDLRALHALGELAEATGAVEAARTRFEEEIERLGTTEPERRHALWLRVAGLVWPGSAPARPCDFPERAADAAEEAKRAAAAHAAHAFAEAAAIAPLDALALAAWSGALAAAGERERWCEVFAAWCDHPDATPGPRDRLALAQVLAERGRPEEAEARLAPALADDPSLGDAWRLSATLREAAGDGFAAATAWERAAACSAGLEAGEAELRAARLLEAERPGAALAALERAVAAAPDLAPAHAGLARVAEREGRTALAVAAATRALAFDPESALLSRDERLDAAVAGARAARALSSWQAAWELGAAALALDPGRADALAAHGLAAVHLGAPGECQRDLEARLALAPPDPRPGELLVALARALEGTNQLEAALARHGEALAWNPDDEQAHAGRLRTLERLGRREEAAAALAEWAEHTADDALRAERLVRAARVARLANPADGRVEGWLRGAIDAEPSHSTAWLELATGLWDAGRSDDAFAAASTGATRVGSPSVRAALETLRGRAFEARGKADAALAAYREAVEADPEAREAALAGGRLLRRRGDWSNAAALLRRAAETRSDGPLRADLWLELARLLAGPLEDVPGALDAFEHARSLAPLRLDLRESYATLLGHVPSRASEARSELAALLEQRPTRSSAIRRLAAILDAAGDPPGARRGLAILGAIGALSPLERDAAPGRLDFPVLSGMTPLDATGEHLCELLLEAPALAPADGEGEAPTALGAGLLDLEPEALASSVREHLARIREARPPRRVRRALRHLDDAALARFDFAAWRQALRLRAWARAVDTREGDLRGVLTALLGESGALPRDALPDDLDLTPWLETSPEALSLLAAVHRAWLRASDPKAG